MLPTHVSLANANAAALQRRSDIAEAVNAVLDRPNYELDYARAKVAFDRLIDPEVDEAWVLGELDRLTKSARELSGPSADDAAKLDALRRTIYESGPWNGMRPLAYDMSDPLGRHLPNALLHNYLANRLGQCVSMPILFLIVGERLGLNLALACAPYHLFIRYTAPRGRAINIEPTSGGRPARDEWIRRNHRVSDRAVETGIYMRSLRKREGVALMASTVVTHLWKRERVDDVIALCEALRPHSPRNVDLLLSQGSAYGKLLDELRERHPHPWLAPPAVRALVTAYAERNMSLFAAAERLGWQPSDEEN